MGSRGRRCNAAPDAAQARCGPLSPRRSRPTISIAPVVGLQLRDQQAVGSVRSSPTPYSGSSKDGHCDPRIPPMMVPASWHLEPAATGAATTRNWASVAFVRLRARRTCVLAATTRARPPPTAQRGGAPGRGGHRVGPTRLVLEWFAWFWAIQATTHSASSPSPQRGHPHIVELARGNGGP